MKILVTGGAGYVGTTLIYQLLESGYHVRVLDNLTFGGSQILPFFRYPHFQFQKGDIRNLEDVRTATQGIDAIIHLAAIVGYPACRQYPQLAKETNVNGTQNLITATSKEQMILYGSTGSNYGNIEEICTEETPLNPLSLYGETKTLAENMLLEERSTIAYRFATAFGVSPRLRLDLLVNDFAQKAFHQHYLVVYEKHFMRTFIHVHDMGRAFIFGIENRDKMVGEVFNIGSDSMNYSKEDVCKMIKKYVDVYVHYADIGEDADKRNYIVSYNKIHSLEYHTTVGVEKGIKELIKTFPAISM